MEIALSKICGDQDIITRIAPECDELMRIKYSQRTCQNERVPLSKYGRLEIASSLYRRRLQRFYNHIPCRRLKNFVSNEIWNNYYKFTLERNPFDKVVSFYYWRGGDDKFNGIYDFIKKGELSRLEGFDRYSINGLLAVDKVYKYENISNICNDISERLQLKEQLSLPEYQAKSHTRKVSDYREILDKKSIELIKIIFAREIELFDYKY